MVATGRDQVIAELGEARAEQGPLMLDHTFEEPCEEAEREFVDAAAERAEGLHDFDPLFTTLRIPREQALTRPVLNPRTLPAFPRAGSDAEGERAA
jgi:hypothetical protein